MGSGGGGLTPLDPSAVAATLALMCFWYLSVGIRLSFMFFSHLSTLSPLYKRFYLHILPAPLQLSRLPTVDRTLQAMRMRALVVMVMSLAEIYAMVLRICLWVRGSLDSIQQEMALKNIMFLISAYAAYDMWTSTVKRNWNSRDLGLGLKIPTRDTQRAIFRWLFVLSFAAESTALTAFLVSRAEGSDKWLLNSACDAAMLLFFILYCGNCHVKSTREQPHCLLPQKAFVLFPGRFLAVVSFALFASLFAARIPALYMMFEHELHSSAWSLSDVTLTLSLSVVPITALGLFSSVSYMLFEREFTAAPDRYHAIHDPTINIVSTSTMIEGCLDVLSASTLVSLAPFGLPQEVNGVVILFALLEMVNACQSFALQAFLSGGHNDTPGDLVQWKARIRACRAVIDFGTFILRITLWVGYDAVSSVFLIKNIYNLIHSVAMVERAAGVDRYSKGCMFLEYVPAYEWYGLSNEEWKDAISASTVLQTQPPSSRAQNRLFP